MNDKMFCYFLYIVKSVWPPLQEATSILHKSNSSTESTVAHLAYLYSIVYLVFSTCWFCVFDF